jgi:hypothetical protein
MAAYDCDIVTFPPTLLALATATVRPTEVPLHILSLFDTVYAWLKGASVRQAGHNFALYDQFGPDGMRMRAGFPVSAAFGDTDLVHCVPFEGGRAAHTQHVGAYSGLPGAQVALREWYGKQSLTPAGYSLEVYGDWQDDPARLETDVYVFLK